MPTYKVTVKWGKEKFQNVEVNTDELPLVFKAQLFALSGVQPDRQKVMMKGSVLKDEDWGNMKLKDGATLLMMGTADQLPQEPVEKTVFVEDMTDQELATVLELPAGLHNLGNTCYMNATLQCLRSVPELKKALKSYSGGLSLGSVLVSDQAITGAVRDLFEEMDKTANAVNPFMMLQVLHMCYPRFSEKSEHGGFMQQDANECWMEIVQCLQRKLQATTSPGAVEGAAASNNRGFIDQYFGGTFNVTMKCIEAEDETATHSTENFTQLSCFIGRDVKYLHTGLINKLKEHIEKHSPTLGRNAQYEKACKISRLPAYLTIQMVRFFFKEKESLSAKILKDIKFPMSLDVFDLCTEELQKKLLPMREKFKEQDDWRLEQAQEAKEGPKKNQMITQDKKEKKIRREPYEFPEDVGSNNSGYYTLQAVLTHKGRSSSSGHYVAWVRRKADEWIMFDDDNVNPVTSEDVLKLSGGGDWHCAYVLLYGPHILEIDEEEEEKRKEAEKAKALEKEKKTEAEKQPMDTSQ